MKEKANLNFRFWEIDFLRGLAIVMMILFHFLYDLDYFGIHDIEISRGFWYYFARLAVSLFLLLVGISLFLSYSRARLVGKEKRFGFRLLKRSAKIFSLAMGITLITYFLVGKGFIVFGVLHLIGISLLLAYPFLILGWHNFIFGSIFVAIGLYLQTASVEYPWLIWLGMAPHGFYSLDYVPVFPWFGVILIGIALGGWQYSGYKRKIPLPDLAESFVAGILTFLGRNSLAIYLLHQPVLISILYLIWAIYF